MNCRVCQTNNSEKDLLCFNCKSENNSNIYSIDNFDKAYITDLLKKENGQALVNHEYSVVWFENHTDRRGLFLDVGCGHGASLAGMWAAGWNVMGFDVMFAGRPKGIFISNQFSSSLIWQKFDVVLCRNTLEFVEYDLLTELYNTLAPKGLCQIVTLSSIDQDYQLVSWNQNYLESRLKSIGFKIIDKDSKNFMLRKD